MVREVLERLAEGREVGRTEQRRDSNTTATSAELASRSAGDYGEFNRRTLEGIKHWLCRERAVITPAVRDRLRDSKIGVRRRRMSDATLRQQHGGPRALVLGVAETSL